MKAWTMTAGLTALALMACKGKDGGDTGPTCEPDAIPSVVVVVTDDAASPLDASSVVYSVDGGATAECQNVDQDWICGRGEYGTIEITATADGCQEGSVSVDVALVDCEVQQESAAVRLTCS